jgi:hypothetical protein
MEILHQEAAAPAGERTTEVTTGTVRIANCHKHFGADSHALASIELTIDEGDFPAILG